MDISTLIKSFEKTIDTPKIIAITEFQAMDDNVLNFSISNLVAEEIIKIKKHRIVDRNKTNEILAELSLGYSGLVDFQKKKKIGEITEADSILSGTYLIRDNTIIIFAKLIDLKTGKIIWTDCSIDLANYDKYLNKFKTKIIEKNIKKIAVLPINYLGFESSRKIDFIAEAVQVYLFKLESIELYERNSLEQVFEEIKMVSEGTVKKDGYFSPVSVEAYLNGYYCFNRANDIDIGFELIHTMDSQVLWADKIYYPKSEHLNYETTLGTITESIFNNLKNYPEIKSVMVINQKNISKETLALKTMIEQDLNRNIINRSPLKVIDRKFMSKIKNEWSWYANEISNKPQEKETLNKIGEIIQADSIMSINLHYKEEISHLDSGTEIFIAIQITKIDTAEVIYFKEFSITDREVPFSFTEKIFSLLNELPHETVYPYLIGYQGSLSQRQGNSLSSNNGLQHNGVGLGFSAFWIQRPYDNFIKNVISIYGDFSSGFNYKNTSDVDVTYSNSTVGIDYGFQFFNRITLSGGLQWAYANYLKFQNGGHTENSWGVISPVFTLSYRNEHLLVAFRNYHFQFEPIKGSNMSNIYSGYALIVGFDFGLNKQKYETK